MKKRDLQSLMNKINVQKDSMSGGFGVLKGGTALLPSYNSGDCSNDTCTGTNVKKCTNNIDCHGSTNNQPGGCTNSVTCFE